AASRGGVAAFKGELRVGGGEKGDVLDGVLDVEGGQLGDIEVGRVGVGFGEAGEDRSLLGIDDSGVGRGGGRLTGGPGILDQPVLDDHGPVGNQGRSGAVKQAAVSDGGPTPALFHPISPLCC